MNRLIKSVALFVTVTCVVWVAVLWRWRASSVDMSVRDIVLYLGVLPLVVFGLLLGLRWAWRGALPRHEAAKRVAAEARATPAAAAAPAAPSREETERHAAVRLIEAHVVSGAGASAADMLVAAEKGEPRPSLDAELRAADGIAVMSSRIVDLDLDAMTDALQPVVETQRVQQPAWAHLDLAPCTQRALAALQGPLSAALQSSCMQLELHASSRQPAAVDERSSARRRTPDTHARVRLLLAWPATWSPFDRAVAHESVLAAIDAHRGDIASERFEVRHIGGGGEELWRQTDQLLLTLARERRDDLVLVAACHSDLDEACIQALEAERRMFCASSNPKGVMPSEAAAALLLANPTWPDHPEAQQPMLLHRPAIVRRDKSVEATGRVSGDSLKDAATQAIAASRLESSGIGALVCDADQHSSRGTELFGVMLEMFGQLDPTEDLRLTGTVTGHVGAVGPLLVIAGAAERARAEDKPCLALALGDPYMRLALVARPQQSPESS